MAAISTWPMHTRDPATGWSCRLDGGGVICVVGTWGEKAGRAKKERGGR